MKIDDGSSSSSIHSLLANCSVGEDIVYTSGCKGNVTSCSHGRQNPLQAKTIAHSSDSYSVTRSCQTGPHHKLR